MSKKELSYSERKSFFIENFSIGDIGGNSVNDKLILISLISLTYLKMKEKNKDVQVLDILMSITKQKADNSCFYHMLESLSILVEDFTFNCTTADSCGLKNSSEIINRIKEILDTWIPF